MSTSTLIVESEENGKLVHTFFLQALDGIPVSFEMKVTDERSTNTGLLYVEDSRNPTEMNCTLQSPYAPY
jgi:hypothetical protein